MQERENIILYEGHLTFSTIGRLLTMLKYQMSEKGIHVAIYKRILSVMIEALENIYKYSDEFHHDEFINRSCIPAFRIDRIQEEYWIECLNPIKNEHIPKLKKKLDIINKADLDGLKLLYRQTISNGEFSEKGGAGLGIIEMAKISGNPVAYKFEKINDQYSSYFISIHFSEL